MNFLKTAHRGVWTVAALVAAAGCSSPLQEAGTRSLRESVVESARRELRDAERLPEAREVTRTPSELNIPAERLDELERMAGPRAYSGGAPPMGPGLLGESAPVFQIDLQQAVLRSARQSLDAERARFDPAISEAEAVAARAAFDWVFFTNFEWNAVDQPSTVPTISGNRLGSGVTQAQSVGYETGIRKPLTTGGTVSLSQGQTYLDDRSPGTTFVPDPSQSTFMDIGVSQPLLRGFGSGVALAEVRLSENLERRAIHEYKSRLIRTVTDTESAYWRLAEARRVLQIRQRLLERGLETRDVLSSRLEFDVKPAEYSDAVATVERRRGNIIRAENTLRQASDQLKALINDDQLTVGNETLLLPVEDPIEQPVRFSLLDSVTTALESRPEVQQAILSIDDAAIRQTVADNARLPALDVAFRSRFQGLDRDTGEAYGDISDGRFVDFILSAVFEQPIGNREAEAGYRAAQLRRMQSTVEYRAVVQRVVLEVKTALRNVTTNYQLIEQTRTARLAAAENLRTLLVQEQTIQSLTPDFLDLKFRRQEALADAEASEVAALTDYAISLAELAAATGTALERSRIDFVVPDAPAEPPARERTDGPPPQPAP
ncbi:MAG: TolC family protein [Planctomycetota bacterium]|nr:TolC family protein [Planctomycetota bacterium]